MSYTKKEDYLTKYGVDLDVIYPKTFADSNVDNAQLIIDYVEEYCYNYLSLNYPLSFINYNDLALDEFERSRELFVLGVLEQIYYITNNSNISNNSGFDGEKITITRNGIERIEMSINALRYFRLGGFCNLW